MIESAMVCAIVVALFAAARWLSGRLGHPPWASPVLLAALAVAAILALTGLPLARFTTAAAPLRWLLGPTLVALALIIDGNRALLRSRALPVLVAVSGGALVGMATAIGMARLLGLDAVLTGALAGKSVTAPFVVAIMQGLDGPVALAAALSVLTGVIGALLVAPMFDALGVKDSAARALGMGVSAHIVGTDWLTRRDARAGGLSALALVLAGLVAAVVLPMLWGRF